MVHQGMAAIDRAQDRDVGWAVHHVAVYGPFEEIGEHEHDGDGEIFPPAHIVEIGDVDVQRGEAGGVDQQDVEPAVVPAATRSRLRRKRCPIDLMPAKQEERVMQNKETQRINEFELIDDHGNEYTIFEHQEGKQKPSLKWISWFRLSDGTPVDKVDENTFKVASTNKFLHRAR